MSGEAAAAGQSSSSGTEEVVKHSGACHCGAVRFEFDGSRDLLAWECDCSICSMRRNTHVIVPAQHFRLMQGADRLSTYQFHTHTARHLFCKVCGITPFYRPRSNPSGYAVTVWCISSAPQTARSITVRRIAGSDWEAAVAGSGIQGLA